MDYSSLDIVFEQSKNNKIRLIWDEFIKMQGRHHDGRIVEVINVCPLGLKFEERKRESV